MTRAFLLVTVGVGTVVGWFASIAVQPVTGPSIAHGFGAMTACLVVGAVFDSLRSQ